MVKQITINDFLNQSENFALIDVRSPSEFQKGHIETAINIPLFNDKERAKGGLLFLIIKQNLKHYLLKMV